MDDLVATLAEDIKKACGGHALSAKLQQTAVNVLTGRSSSNSDRWQKVSMLKDSPVCSASSSGYRCQDLHSDQLVAAAAKLGTLIAAVSALSSKLYYPVVSYWKDLHSTSKANHWGHALLSS